MKDRCINCKRETLYNKETHINFKLGYIKGVGQLCLDCYSVIYGLTPKLQGMNKLTNNLKKSAEA